MLMSRVRIHRGQLNYFRALARDTKKEVLAYLVGEVVSPELVRVDYFDYPSSFEIQTENAVQATEEAQNKIEEKAVAKNLKVVGTVHSHGDWVPILSPTDYRGHITGGDRISGVVGRNGRRTRVYFWVAESALPMKIEYTT
jgi:proteasome lid subunit RPN8/RPN11